MRLRSFILTSVACPDRQQNSSTLSHKRHDFRKNGVMKRVVWFSLQILSKTFLIQEKFREIWSEIYIGLMYYSTRFLWGYNEKSIFITVLFWVITWRAVVIYYRRLGTSYPSLLRGPRIQKKSLLLDFWPCRWDR